VVPGGSRAKASYFECRRGAGGYSQSLSDPLGQESMSYQQTKVPTLRGHDLFRHAGRLRLPVAGEREKSRPGLRPGLLRDNEL